MVLIFYCFLISNISANNIIYNVRKGWRDNSSRGNVEKNRYRVIEIRKQEHPWIRLIFVQLGPNTKPNTLT